jgi:hypothetical protein
MTVAPLASALATNNFGDTRAPGGVAGPIALLVLLVIAAATIFLIRNMNARLRRLPESFPDASAQPPSSAAGPEATDEPAGEQPAGGQPAGDQRSGAERTPPGP